MLKWDGRLRRINRTYGKPGDVTPEIDLSGVSIELTGGRVTARDRAGNVIRQMDVQMATIRFEPGEILFEAVERDPDLNRIYPNRFVWTLWPH